MNTPTPSPGAVRAAEKLLPTGYFLRPNATGNVKTDWEHAARIIDRETVSGVSGIEANVCREIAERQSKGIAKYGQQLADNPAPLSERLQHAKEESMDQTCYLEWARVEAVRLEAGAEKLAEALDQLTRHLMISDFDHDESWSVHQLKVGHIRDARAALAAWKEGRV